MRKAFLLPGLAVVGGGVGLALRRWHLETAFEPDTGLPIAGQPATIALLAFSVVLALLLALLTGRIHRIFDSKEPAFSAKGSFPVLLCLVAAGGLAAISGVSVLLLQLRGEFNVIRMVQGVLCILAAVAFLAMGRSYYRGSAPSSSSVLPLLPGYAACFWLMASYQVWSKDPVISDYVCFLFALVFGAMSYYFIASFSFGKSPVFATCLTGLLGVYCAIVTIADGHNLTDLLLLLALILYLLPHLFILIGRDSAPYPTPQPDGNPDHPIKEDA